MFQLKPLSPSAIPAALAKAERYRLLNEPEQAESICEDILATQPDHRDALIVLLLALSDRFPYQDGWLVSRAQTLVAKLDTEYDRAYYGGLVAERRARALLGPAGGPSQTVGRWLSEAMSLYERAESVRPAGNDDACLRWNACARLFNQNPGLLVTDDERSMPAMLE